MQNDLFEKAPNHKAYFQFTLPVVFSMVISLVYNMVDTYFIARTGNTALVAGVSICAPVFTLMIALGADAETMVYASQYFTFIALGAPFIIVALTHSKSVEDGRICRGIYVRNGIRLDYKHNFGSGLHFHIGIGCGRCGYSNSDWEYLYRCLFCVVPAGKKPEAVC